MVQANGLLQKLMQMMPQSTTGLQQTPGMPPNQSFGPQSPTGPGYEANMNGFLTAAMKVLMKYKPGTGDITTVSKPIGMHPGIQAANAKNTLARNLLEATKPGSGVITP